MSIVEKIQNLPENTVTQDDNFIMLSEALSEYHRLIQEGKLVPRKNNLENIYTTYSFHSNANYQNYNFVIILLSQTVVRTLSRQPFFYTVRYSFPLFFIFPGNRKTRRTEVLRVSYVWTQRYLTITNLYSDCITQ